ncbi:NAD(P)H-hydrate dehydratase [Bosea sp. TWI1241]|uniref:NAD(P)H-hydrate dehydratase n=1 Tax=Bosea sp. TWI1241 TaxID=3148904 RepID=UPI0032099B1F
MTAADLDSLALLTAAQMAACDAATIPAGTKGIVLMERAGRAVAEAALRRTTPGERILVLCGPGNNGGDGFVAARLLAAEGRAVSLALAGDPAALRGDAALAAGGWSGAVLPLAEASPEGCSLVIDALFGAGLSRPLEGEVAAMVTRLNRLALPVLAVDMPSGASGDSGLAAGVAVQAAETVTFFRLKPGHLLHPGRALCGAVTLADIGIDPAHVFGPGGVTPYACRNAPGLWQVELPRHGEATHKFGRGAVLVAAGGLAGVGAPRLGARAALRSGAGLATILCTPDALPVHAARGPDAVMQVAIADEVALDELLDTRRAEALLIGPALGLDERGHALTLAALRRATLPAVFDADAVTHLARDPELAMQAGPARQAPFVLTPHEGEFMRLFGHVAACAPGLAKPERAAAAARLSGGIVVLKGADSVIAAPDGRLAINATGSPALATAGSGDVLGGIITGLLAQGMPAFEAACAAVYLHGRAGERLGMGLIADELPEALPPLLVEVRGQASHD